MKRLAIGCGVLLGLFLGAVGAIILWDEIETRRWQKELEKEREAEKT